MENKNIMLVIASIALFFVIVIAVGLWLFWPEKGSAAEDRTATIKPIFDKEFDTYEYYKSGEEPPGLMELPEVEDEEKEEITLTIGESEETEGIVIEEEPKPGYAAPAAKPSEDPTHESQPKQTEGVQPARREAEKPAVKSPAQINVKEYEIQVGSYETRRSAESVNVMLKDLGFAGMIRTRDFDGKTFYRVRLGPYSNHEEAVKFLGWIKDIEGLEQSYISQVTRMRSVN